jgi:hypothetical protein
VLSEILVNKYGIRAAWAIKDESVFPSADRLHPESLLKLASIKYVLGTPDAQSRDMDNIKISIYKNAVDHADFADQLLQSLSSNGDSYPGMVRDYVSSDLNFFHTNAAHQFLGYNSRMQVF